MAEFFIYQKPETEFNKKNYQVSWNKLIIIIKESQLKRVVILQVMY